jgi:hypothetical protein
MIVVDLQKQKDVQKYVRGKDLDLSVSMSVSVTQRGPSGRCYTICGLVKYTLSRIVRS